MDGKFIAIITLTILDLASLILVVVFNGINATGAGDIFNYTAEGVSAIYETEITPAGYTFIIWTIIYIWQFLWVLYSIVNIFRQNDYGSVLMNPLVLPVTFHIFWIASCGLNIGWLFVWDSENPLWAFIVLLAFTASGYVAVAIHCVATVEHEKTLRDQSKVDLILIRLFIQNGLDILFSWTTIATFLNLSSALSYDPLVKNNMSIPASSSLALGLLGAIIILWSVLENTVFFEYFRFVYAWYGVLVWASIGILVKNYNPASVNTFLVFIDLFIALVCLGIKISVYYYRTFRSRKNKVDPYDDVVTMNSSAHLSEKL